MSRIFSRSRDTTSRSPAASELLVEWYGAGVLISDPADPPYECWRLLDALTPLDGDPVVLVSPRAYGHPRIAETVIAVCRQVVDGPGDITGLRPRLVFAPAGDPNGPYAGAIAELARTSGSSIEVTDGPVLTLPGGGFYAGPATGAWGWREFAPDGTTNAVGYRYPAPAWERALPRDATGVGGLLAEPTPAGLILRDARGVRVAADDPLLLLASDPRRPVLIVDVDGTPAAEPGAVADLFAGVPRSTPRRLIVAPGRQPEASWLAALGDRFVLDEDTAVVPTPLALHGGWQRHGTRSFTAAGSCAAGEAPVVEVLPGGLLLRPGGDFTSDAVAWYCPQTAELTVGTPGRPIPDRLIDVLEQIWHSGPASLRVAGGAVGAVRSRLSALATAHGLACHLTEGAAQ